MTHKSDGGLIEQESMPSSTRNPTLSDEEMDRVVELIGPCFDKYVAKYDERKYPREIYENLLDVFRVSQQVTDDAIRTAVFWKFGHLGKRRIPAHHEVLISLLQRVWPGLSPALTLHL